MRFAKTLKALIIFSSVIGILSFFNCLSYAESVIDEGSAMLYIEAVQDLPNNGDPTGWTALNYDTSQDDGKGDDGADWQTGTYGVGYGDADDNTVIDNADGSVYSVYTRAEFNVVDAGEVVSMTLQVDYDDGFIAWLNGVEVARSTSMSGIDPAWNAVTASDREASQTNPPTYETFDISAFTGNLVNGRNVLAIGVWNRQNNSSDLSLIPKLNLFYSASDSPVLTRYPYIQKAGTDTVTIVWNTDIASDSEVEYGLTQGYGSVASDASLETQHIVTLTGLSAGSTYYYRVSSNGTVLTSSGTTFQTNKVGTFTFVVIGDSGIASPAQSGVSQIIKDTNPDLALHTGDVVYPSGEAENYNPYFFVPYKDTLKRVSLYPTIGNHDTYTDNGQPYLDAFILPGTSTERYYSFDYANAHFVCLDVQIMGSPEYTDYLPGSDQYNWLVNDLSNTTKPWKFVFFHKPPYSSNRNSVHRSDEDIQDNLCPVFEDHGVDMVFSGHSHNYERTMPIATGTVSANGVTYVVTGGAGAMIAPFCEDGGFDENCLESGNWWTDTLESTYHLTKVTVFGNFLRLRAINSDGRQFDFLSIVRDTLIHVLFPPYDIRVIAGARLGPIRQWWANISKTKYQFYIQPYAKKPDGKIIWLLSKPILITADKGFTKKSYSLNIPSSSETGTFYYGVKLTTSGTLSKSEVIDDISFPFTVTKGSITKESNQQAGSAMNQGFKDEMCLIYENDD